CGVKSGENSGEEDGNSGGSSSKYPFAGGSGAGVSINPVAFMVVGQGQIKLLPVTINSSLEKILDMVPDIVEKANQAIKKKIKVRKTIKEFDDEEA
ncbi:MAG TPA: sporulation protein YtfJ, partial [Clostridium sp.]|nr:sporulation protein YtfJ [Clostridium sp.]